MGLVTLAVGAALGAGFTVLFQLFDWLLRHARSKRFLTLSLGLLNRHILASQKSLALTAADQPIYVQVARVRFCKSNSALLPEDMNRFGLISRNNERVRILLSAVRNSDIFLEEIADHLGAMTFEGRARALSDASENMLILGRFVARLDFGYGTATIDSSADIAADVTKTSNQA